MFSWGRFWATSRGDALITFGLAAGVLALLWALHKELVFASFDPTGASVIGIPTQALDYTLLVLLALVIVIALQAVGIVLVISMLITPAATAQLLVRNFTQSMALGAGIGASSAIVGLYLSFHYNLPSGPAMALVATGFFILSVVYAKGISSAFARKKAG